MKRSLVLIFLTAVLAGTLWFLLAPRPDADADGAALFAAHCAHCHGTNGRGDGQVARVLETAPPDLTRIAARRDGIWPMLDIMAIIDGYAKGTNPREGMPVLWAITDGPMVNFDPGNGLPLPTPKRLIAVTDYLETIQSPRPEHYVP